MQPTISSQGSSHRSLGLYATEFIGYGYISVGLYAIKFIGIWLQIFNLICDQGHGDPFT